VINHLFSSHESSRDPKYRQQKALGREVVQWSKNIVIESSREDLIL